MFQTFYIKYRDCLCNVDDSSRRLKLITTFFKKVLKPKPSSAYLKSSENLSPFCKALSLEKLRKLLCSGMTLIWPHVMLIFTPVMFMFTLAVMFTFMFTQAAVWVSKPNKIRQIDFIRFNMQLYCPWSCQTASELGWILCSDLIRTKLSLGPLLSSV